MRIRLAVAVAVVAVALPAIAGAASASTLEPNPNAKSQGSCVGVASSQVKHNGAVVREQARSGERAEAVAAAREGSCSSHRPRLLRAGGAPGS